MQVFQRATLKLRKFKEFKIPVFRPLLIAILLLVAVEMGGIWREVIGIRREQVKNAASILPPEVLNRLGSNPNGQMRLRRLAGRSSTNVEEWNASESVNVDIVESDAEVAVKPMILLASESNVSEPHGSDVNALDTCWARCASSQAN